MINIEEHILKNNYIANTPANCDRIALELYFIKRYKEWF